MGLTGYFSADCAPPTLNADAAATSAAMADFFMLLLFRER
jgi:hypothetical protein